ncbi:recombinase family protein [Bradyrhizobium erythrophlei]|uniref:recombinase family protein n=1 Tax=Bradyrhizobium erythrophlei TaxID=1437360 RepID=UPI0009A818E2|nr:recombinase family protein [Bradyrhizobium erythrophlei]
MKTQAYSYLRMSTDDQLKGDSRRRQLEASRAYAEANGLELAQGAELEDIGVSAFKGMNAREGALGQFLEAVRSDRVKPGSYLIVESLDRLSREEVLKAQSLFLSIIQAGINLVTLMDGRVYRAGMTDLADLIMSLVIMSRAHEESLTKSRRIAAAWKNKRTQATDRKPMTKWCPAWLALSPDRSRYLQIPERVEVVRQIFRDTAAGVGMYSIASRLNKTKVPTFGGPNGWHQTYVAKILANRAVLGELQPHVRVEGKRVAEGESVPGYYPAVVDEELFYQAQFATSQRRGSGAGRKGTAFTNLFSGIAKCAYCRSPILYENKGVGAKGGKYLVCDGAKRQRGCPSARWRYQDFEASFLAFVEELDIEGVINATSHSEKRNSLERDIAALRGELLSVNGLMEKTYAVLNQGGPVEFVTGKLNELEQRRTELTKGLGAKSLEQQELLGRESRYHRGKEEIRQLVDMLQSPSSEDLFKIRAKVASQLKALIDTLLVASIGESPRIRKSIDQMKKLDAQDLEDVIAQMEQRAGHPDQSKRYFSVAFRDSAIRIVFPADGDPLRYQQQVVARGGTIEAVELEDGAEAASDHGT